MQAFYFYYKNPYIVLSAFVYNLGFFTDEADKLFKVLS